MKNAVIEVIGWLAAVLILAAYALLSSGKLEARSRTYQLLNVVGSGGVIINSGWNGAIPSAVLNVVWMAVGIYALWKIKATQKAP